MGSSGPRIDKLINCDMCELNKIVEDIMEEFIITVLDGYKEFLH